MSIFSFFFQSLLSLFSHPSHFKMLVYETTFQCEKYISIEKFNVFELETLQLVEIEKIQNRRMKWKKQVHTWLDSINFVTNWFLSFFFLFVPFNHEIIYTHSFWHLNPHSYWDEMGMERTYLNTQKLTHWITTQSSLLHIHVNEHKSIIVNLYLIN